MDFYPFKISRSPLSAPPQSIFGIIDASGSMQNYWKWVAELWNEKIPKEICTTITFDTSARICPSNKLSEHLKQHGGGGTNIVTPFQLFETELKKIEPSMPITVIFISDGQDNRISTLHERFAQNLKGDKNRVINFICLGIEKNFPTFISMKLRELYHTGDQNIPALYLIEYTSEKAFFNKFESMKQYFEGVRKRDVVPEVRLFPWDKEEVEQVFEDTWVISKDPLLLVDDSPFNFDTKSLSIDNMVDIFRIWSQRLQLQSLTTPTVSQENACICLKYMRALIVEFEKENKLSLFSKESEESDLKLTFSQRVKKNIMKNIGSRITWFLDEVTTLSKGLNPNNLSEFDAAKRLGIGTITGKYHQKALALKGITVDTFKKISEEFIDFYKATIFRKEEEIGLDKNDKNADSKNDNIEEEKKEDISEEMRSVISLQTQREVFLEPEFCEAINLCKTQYDLVEAFPLIGYAIKIKRFNGSMLDPWLIQVRFIALQHKFIDLSSLVKNQMRMDFPNGDRKEEVNAILPLFTNKKDFDLKKLINSRLYRLIMTFVVMQNIDTFYEEAYFALLASSFCFILNFKENEWRNNMLARIYKTIKFSYGEEGDFKNYLTSFQTKDYEKIFYKGKDQTFDNRIDLSKPLVTLYYVYKKKLLEKDDLKKIFEYILVEYFHRVYSETGKKSEKFFFMNIKNKNLEKEVLDEIDNVYTVSKFVKLIHEKIGKRLECDDAIFLNKRFIYNSEKKIHLELMDKLFSIIFKEEFKSDSHVIYIIHALKYLEEFSRFKHEIIIEKEQIKKLSTSIRKEFSKSKFVEEFSLGLKSEYVKKFAQNHFLLVVPKTEELKKICEEKGIDSKNLNFTALSGFPNNACLSPKCPFYLKITDASSFKKHLDSWVGKLPMGFHTLVKSNKEKEIDEILELWKKNGKNQAEDYGVEEEFIREYIKKVRESYKVE